MRQNKSFVVLHFGSLLGHSSKQHKNKEQAWEKLNVHHKKCGILLICMLYYGRNVTVDDVTKTVSDQILL